MLDGKRVWVAGHRGMVGAALMRRLWTSGCELLTVSSDELDLRRQADTEAWMASHRPQVIFLAAARVGGILANDSRPGEFLYDNLAIETNVMEAARRTGAEKLVFLGSSCIYPKHAPQPMTEDMLLTGPLEPTNQWYAIAKIAGILMAQAYRRQYGCDFICAQPTNLYGPQDNFDLTSSHVVPALMRKAHEARLSGAREMVLWGTGSPRREFLHVDDLADALVFLAENYSGEQIVNIGTGEDLTISELAGKIAAVTGFTGTLAFDPTKPDGTPRKLLDVSALHRLGWTHSIGLDEGLASTYQWFLGHEETARGIAAE